MFGLGLDSLFEFQLGSVWFALWFSGAGATANLVCWASPGLVLLSHWACFSFASFFGRELVANWLRFGFGLDPVWLLCGFAVGPLGFVCLLVSS